MNAKSFSDIKGGDLEGQMKLHRGEKPEPPKKIKAEGEEESPPNVEYITLQIALSYNHKGNIPIEIQAEMFGKQFATWLEDNIEILESKGIYLQNIIIDSDFDYEFKEHKEA